MGTMDVDKCGFKKKGYLSNGSIQFIWVFCLIFPTVAIEYKVNIFFIQHMEKYQNINILGEKFQSSHQRILRPMCLGNMRSVS